MNDLASYICVCCLVVLTDLICSYVLIFVWKKGERFFKFFCALILALFDVTECLLSKQSRIQYAYFRGLFIRCLRSKFFKEFGLCTKSCNANATHTQRLMKIYKFWFATKQRACLGITNQEHQRWSLTINQEISISLINSTLHHDFCYTSLVRI